MFLSTYQTLGHVEGSGHRAGDNCINNVCGEHEGISANLTEFLWLWSLWRTPVLPTWEESLSACWRSLSGQLPRGRNNQDKLRSSQRSWILPGSLAQGSAREAGWCGGTGNRPSTAPVVWPAQDSSPFWASISISEKEGPKDPSHSEPLWLWEEAELPHFLEAESGRGPPPTGGFTLLANN